jgi:DNA-binding transcriptional LysR family regulator
MHSMSVAHHPNFYLPRRLLGGLRDGALVRVLPQHRLRASNVFALYASRRYLDAKIRTFVEFLRDAVPPAIVEREPELAGLEAA